MSWRAGAAAALDLESGHEARPTPPGGVPGHDDGTRAVRDPGGRADVALADGVGPFRRDEGGACGPRGGAVRFRRSAGARRRRPAELAAGRLPRLGRNGSLLQLSANVLDYAVELLAEFVEVVRHRVQVRAPGHRVLRDQGGLGDLLLRRAEQPRRLAVEVDAVPAPRRGRDAETDQLLVL